MRLSRSAALGVLISSLLAGCVGVPTLYRPPVRADGVAPAGEVLLAPKVADIVDEVACELGKAKNKGAFQTPYVITILLTIQVDDNLDLTPSLSFIHPFALAGQNRTLSVSGDLGGARKRNFTTTYYLDSARLDVSACSAKRGHEKLYQLSGDLGLRDIVRDGEGTIAKEAGICHPPANATDKSIPTYGSLVQFVVTKAVTGLGPVWTLTRFKGPSGANGLLNGKRLNTESVMITFAKVFSFAKTVAQVTAEAEKEQTNVDRLKAEGHRDEAQAELLRRQQFLDTAKVDYSSVPRARMSDRRPLALRVDAAQSEVAAGTRELHAAEVEVNDAMRRDKAAETKVATVAAATQADAPAAETLAGQALLTTMVLQNLNVQPR